MSETRRPGFADVDQWGLTHVGKVRKVNMDHFFLGALARGVTSYRGSVVPEVPVERLASLAIVADGIGSSKGGEEAARRAVQALVSEVSSSFHVAEVTESTDPKVFNRLLQDAALACHESLVKLGEKEPDQGHFATTLTLFLGLWPDAYLLQVGDSRGYVFRDGELTQISRDQTVAQDLVDQGVMTRSQAYGTQWAHVLSSAIGGEQAAPVVTRITRGWGDVILLCSDGLNKHVSDERIAEVLGSMTEAKQACELLLNEALDAGGTDNIAIVIGRSLRPEGA